VSLLDLLNADAFRFGAVSATWLELTAFILALVMVAMNIRERIWGWPLAIVSSALYLVVFWHSGLYADACLQAAFIALAGWGWLQWLLGHRDDGSSLHPARLSRRHATVCVGAGAFLWLVIGVMLARYTDSTVVWWDAFTTAASLVGQYLLGRKFLANWAVWLVVNVVSTGLYAVKGLWLTVVLYALFAALSVVGWRAWQRRLAGMSSSAAASAIAAA
jgi:nicotinamide mononucleotide transporter